jgi:hypothetical protein
MNPPLSCYPGRTDPYVSSGGFPISFAVMRSLDDPLQQDPRKLFGPKQIRREIQIAALRRANHVVHLQGSYKIEVHILTNP